MTGSRGPFGYPDYQHVENWEGPPFAGPETVKVEPAREFIIDRTPIRIYGYTTGQIHVYKGIFTIEAFWWATKEGGAATFGKSWTMEEGIGERAIAHLLNQGEFIEIVMINVSSEDGEIEFRFSGTNRAAAQEFVPITSPLRIASSEGKMKPNYEEFYNVSSIAAGPAQLILKGQGHPATIELAAHESGFGAYPLAFGEVTATIDSVTLDVTLPPAPLQIAITNGAVEQELTATLTV